MVTNVNINGIVIIAIQIFKIQWLETMIKDKTYTWDFIYSNIKHNYHESALKDFVVIKREDDYVLLSKDDIDFNYDSYESNLIPYHFFINLEYFLEQNIYGFDKYPSYHFVRYLYKYQDDINTYMLIWFNVVLKQILSNDASSLFCKELLKHVYRITFEELQTRDIEPAILYGQNRTNFCPIDSLTYQYEYMTSNLDGGDILMLIEYISLIIDRIKSSYRMIIIY